MDSGKHRSIWHAPILPLGSYIFGFNFHNVIHELGHAVIIWSQGGTVHGFVLHLFLACYCSSTPDPFGDMTQIRFELTATENVCLGIYDSRGGLVRRFPGETLRPGFHVVEWHGQADRGRRLASGTYLYEVRAGRERSTGVVTLLR